MKTFSIMTVLLFCLIAGGCDSDTSNSTAPPTDPNQPDASLGLEAVPGSLGSDYATNFNRYTKVVAPNGGFIHILAQSQITNEQIVRARNVLEHYLTDYPGSQFGNDKSEVADKMADNKATLLLMNGKDDGSNTLELPGQPLFQEEIQVEGHDWYINQDYKNHRDATFEEILHLVHDYGIGVDGPGTQPGALPEYQSEIRPAQQNALASNLWGIDSKAWTNELSKENSLSQEYLAAVVDVYYGLWGAWQQDPTHGMQGLYVSKTRDAIVKADPMGAELMNNKFFHPYLTYNARISADFKGTFSLGFDQGLPYTHHSQYLRNITLTGINDSNVRIGGFNNDITGNNGTNTIVFSGKRSEYTIIKGNSDMTVTDSHAGRDGSNTLRHVDKLQFKDKTIWAY